MNLLFDRVTVCVTHTDDTFLRGSWQTANNHPKCVCVCGDNKLAIRATELRTREKNEQNGKTD